jgi:predicted kinase
MAPWDFGGWFEAAELVGGEKVLAHPRKDCVGRHCCIHNPSNHHMRDWPQHFRADRALTERTCPHGIGHPDPDDLHFKRLMAGTDEVPDAVHGCDGCCRVSLLKCKCCGPKKKEKPVTTLTMTKGLPGSGKTTWAREQVLKAIPGSVVIVCKDDLRAMLHADRWHGKNERQVVKARDALVELFLLQGISVIVADTNLNPAHEERLARMAETRGARFFVKDFTDVRLNTCISRDLKREKSVGEKVIRDMYAKYLTPAPSDPPEYVEGRPHAVLVDLDGTLAKMADRSPFDWDRVDEDEAHQDVVDLVNTLRDAGAEVIFVSGRDARAYKRTRSWLVQHVGDWTPLAPLLMRSEYDMRKDSIVKEEIYRQEILGRYNVWMVLDDRAQVVDMWRNLGLRVLQVAPGNF